MTDPKREAAVAALLDIFAEQAGDITDYTREAAATTLDAMLANPQPFLAVLLRVDALAMALSDVEVRTMASPTQPGPQTMVDARAIYAALTETAAEPARSKEPTDG